MLKRKKMEGLLLTAALAACCSMLAKDPATRASEQDSMPPEVGETLSQSGLSAEAKETWEQSAPSAEARATWEQSAPSAEAKATSGQSGLSAETKTAAEQSNLSENTDKTVDKTAAWTESPAARGLAIADAALTLSMPDTAPALTSTWTPPLPSRWSALEEGRAPVVRSQGKYGTCWALTAVSALETALLPKERLVFSADHMALNNAYTVDINEGGDYQMAMAYLSGWQGPVLEEEDPYGDGYSPEGLEPAVHVQEMRIMERATLEELKEAIHTYGAVQASLYMWKSMTEGRTAYYNPDASAFYCPETMEECHEVLILGWDDSFSRFQFSQIPDRDGAFICQNSWGEEFGEDGIFYVSYADANLGVKSILYTRVEPVTNYDRLYQTDDCGWVGRQGYEEESCWFANVYTAQDNETLAAAGFYATGPDTAYEIYLSRDVSDGFRHREPLASGTLPQAGYYTIDFPAGAELSAGESFGILVRIHTPGATSPVAVEYRANEYTQKVTTENKYGYISQDGQLWTHTESRYGTNICLKAYTRIRSLR